MTRAGGPRLVLMGGPADTGNLGVTALGRSTATELARRLPDLDLTVLDNGLGSRQEVREVAGRPFAVRLLGIRRSRRIHRPESIVRIRAALRAGGRGSATARAIVTADAVLDVSGGDSFTDLYGDWRFRFAVEPKELVLRSRRPLVLLPQTIGPFGAAASRRRAAAILRRSDMVWVRDPDSFDVLAGLLGADLDGQRHRVGVDVAFALEPAPPAAAVPEPLGGWLGSSDGVPLAGINVSGLLVNRPDVARARFATVLDHRELAVRLAAGLVDAGARVVLVPHVVVPDGDPESDLAACAAVWEALDERRRSQVAIAPAWSDPSATKWLIAHLDWFTGARMHATIAALSTGVPVSGIAYSDKIAGVFETCGVRDRVLDARTTSTDEAFDRLRSDWDDRDRTREELRARAVRVRRTVDEQFDVIAARCLEHARRSTPTR